MVYQFQNFLAGMITSVSYTHLDVYKRQVGAPGVPGGTVMASLGLITGVLGFNDTGTALMLTIFALQDSFGTACNVTGDGALTMILTGYANRHNIEKQENTLEL